MNLKVHPLSPQEHFDADMISLIAFHMRTEDLEKMKEKSQSSTVEDWGAFDPDGRIMARILNYRFDCTLDGKLVQNGGIGAVSTLPEYRECGAVRAIFSELLPSAYRNGEVISTLFPFKHAFYRKFGYEAVCFGNIYTFPPEILKDYHFGGQAEQWKPKDAIGDYLDLYNSFAGRFNLAIHRSEELFRKAHFDGLYYKDRKFAYLLREKGTPVAYVIFQDVRHDPAAVLKVEDLAWKDREGFLAILGFLGRFTADYGKIELPLPSGLELYSVIHSPDLYGISKSTQQGYMIRVINAQKLLEAMHRPITDSFTIQVTLDEYIPENNGIWTVSEKTVSPAEKTALPDLVVSIRALGQMASGAVSLTEAEYREDVRINSRRDLLEKVFVRKPVLVQDHF